MPCKNLIPAKQSKKGTEEKEYILYIGAGVPESKLPQFSKIIGMEVDANASGTEVWKNILLNLAERIAKEDGLQYGTEEMQFLLTLTKK
jgi:hypothetical protein